jgi:hypothetical protein
VIPHFPDPYPGEAFFSVYARFCERLGLSDNSRTSRFLFGKSCRVSIQLPHGFDQVVENLPLGHSHTADQLIDNNTVLPLFAPFLESRRYQNARSVMRGNYGGTARLMLGASGTRAPNRLKHCSVCDAENRDRFGETFWARLHQITGVKVCPVHRCYLEDTSITRVSKGNLRVLSAESVCRNTTPHYLDESDPEQVVQFCIARDAAWLLDVNRLRPGPEALSKSYLFCATKQGFASGGRFRQQDLYSAFIRHYSRELLRLLDLEIVEGKESWLRRFFPVSGKIQYPIRHLIVMHFFGFAVADFFDQLPEEEVQTKSAVQSQIGDFVDAPSPGSGVFGVAPWPCRNPVSDCRGKLLIMECTERVSRNYDRSKDRKLIGDFVCPQCGCAYSRFAPQKDTSKRLFWIRDYGHAWIAELRKVWANRRYSVVQAASHLGVTVRVVRIQAFRCGLVFPKSEKKTPRRAKDRQLQHRSVVGPSTGTEAFGEAPWPCRNPVSDCLGKLLIMECTERLSRNRGQSKDRKLIGDFVCPQCDFAYSRFAARQNITKHRVWVRDYGHVWIAELRKIWADPRSNMIQVASHLGVTVTVVRTQACRCGLVFPKPGKKTPQRAKDWRLQRLSVFWANRDTDLSRRVVDAASTLFQAPGKPVRVTQHAIFRLLEGSVYRCRHLDKLPATVLSLSKVVECEEEFCHRLLRHAVIEDVSACVPLQGWRLKRAVGYWRLKRFPSLRLEIDCLLARSGAAI